MTFLSLRKLFGAGKNLSRQPRRSSSKRPWLETLEDRTVPTTLFVNDNWFIANDVGPAGLSAGDTVDNSLDAGAAPVSGTFGVDAFSTVQSAVTAAPVGATILVLRGDYTENVTINKNLSLLSDEGRGATTITGISNGALGTLRITSNTTALQIGAAGQGFTIIGINNPSAGLESAAVYFSGSHSNAQIRDNEIRANGDAGLITEFGATISGFVIDGNEFSGQTFLGTNPAGDGFGAQFSLANVPRQLVVMGNGGGAATGLTTNLTFTNNLISGTAGGISTTNNSGATVAAHEQGNTLVTLDVSNSTISGNTFAGTTTLFGSALRVRRPGNDISGNSFSSAGMGATTTHLFIQNNNLDAIVAANSFSGGVYLSGGAGVGMTIQGGINAAPVGATVYVLPGTYHEDVTINKSLTLQGAGADSTTIVGVIGGSSTATVRIAASNVTLAGFTITRAGNTLADWNNAGLNSIGVAIQGQAITNAIIRDNVITGNRNGIDINHSNGHTIRNNVIDDNRTGILFRNQTDNLTVVENAITNNWTIGILFLDAGGSGPQSALNSTFSNNNISGNWYAQIEDRQASGLLPAPGTTNLKNFSGNWFGTTTPVIAASNGTEPGYAALIPVAFGGTAVAPGGQPDIAGAAAANFDITPLLASGTDTDVETTPGRGTFGFQGDFSTLVAHNQLAQVGALGRINEAIGLVSGSTVIVQDGTYNEDVLVNIDDLTLQSVNGAAATIINGQNTGGSSGVVRTLGGIDNFTLGGAGIGFTLNGAGQAAVYLGANNSGHTIQDNVLNAATGKNALLAEGGQSNHLIQDNTFGGNASQMVYINGTASVNVASTNVDFIDNTFTGTATGPLLGQEASDSDITGNLFTGTSSYANLELWGSDNNVAGNTFNADGGGAYVLDPADLYDIDTLVADNFFTANLVSLERGGALVSGVWGQIQSAINAAQNGDTVHIQAGSYTEDVSTLGKTLTLAPGAGPGQVVLDGNLTLGSATTLAIEVEGTNALTQYDNFSVSGDIVLGGAALSLSGAYVPSVGDAFTILAGDTVSGALAGGSTITFNGKTLQVSYTGSAVVLTAIPVAANFDVDVLQSTLNVNSNGQMVVKLNETSNGALAELLSAGPLQFRLGGGSNGEAWSYASAGTMAGASLNLKFDTQAAWKSSFEVTAKNANQAANEELRLQVFIGGTWVDLGSDLIKMFAAGK